MTSLKWVVSLAVFGWASAVWSQQGETSGQQGPWRYGVAAGIVHQFEADFDEGDGDFSVDRLSAQGSVRYEWDRRTSVGLTLNVVASDYDFSSEASLGVPAPWGDLREYRLSVPMRFSPTERADVVFIPSIRSRIEDGASLSDGDTAGAIIAGSWRVSDTLTLGPGVGVFSKVGGGTTTFPVVLINWNINDKTTLATERGIAGSTGPGLALTYQLAEKWKLGIAGRWEKHRFALDGKGVLEDGVGEDKGAPLVLTFEYRPSPGTRITGFAGAKIEGNLRTEDSRDKLVGKSDFDTAPMIGIGISTRL